MSTPWPVAELDPIRRLYLMATAVRGAHVSERTFDAPVERVWSVLTDFTGGFAVVQADMLTARLLRRETRSDQTRPVEDVEIAAVSRFGFRATLRGTVRPGSHWLQSRFLIVAMAVTPESGNRTRVALTGGVRVPGNAAIVPVRVRREAERSLDRLADLFGP